MAKSVDMPRISSHRHRNGSVGSCAASLRPRRASSGTPKRKTATYGRTIDLPAIRNTSRSTNGMQQTQINRPKYTPNDGSRVVGGGTTRSVPVSTAATGTLLRGAPRREHDQFLARQRPALTRQFFSQLKPEALRVKPQRRISV